MSTQIATGHEALLLMRDPAFSAAWDELHRTCGWATAFQHRLFANAWYRAYSGRYTPVLVYAKDQGTYPNAILPLAQEVVSGRLVIAGDRLAEYHAWICPTARSDRFIRDSLETIRLRFPGEPLDFRYLPPGTPLGFLDSSSRTDDSLRRRTRLEGHARPLLDLTEDGKTTTVKNKNIRVKINRLKRFGELQFRVVTESEEFADFFEKLSQMAALRHEALHGGTGGYPNTPRRAFYEALLPTPDMLHVSGLWLGAELIAGHVGIARGAICHLGVVSHHPVYARHSPGRVHMHMLANSLCEMGMEVLDLTPGGDAYKETLATRHDTVSRLTVYATAHEKAAVDRREQLARGARRVIAYFGIAPAQARESLEKIRRLGVSTIIRKSMSVVGLLLPKTIEYRVYSYPVERARALPSDDGVAINSLRDLIGFSPFEAWQTRSGFLSSSLARLENDARVYTIAEEGQLLHYGWMLFNQAKSQLSEVRQEISFPAGTVLLYDFCTHPRARGRGLYQRSVRRMLRDAAAAPDVSNIYIGVLADNLPSRHVIEKLGFDHVRTLRTRRFMSKWSALP